MISYCITASSTRLFLNRHPASHWKTSYLVDFDNNSIATSLTIGHLIIYMSIMLEYEMSRGQLANLAVIPGAAATVNPVFRTFVFF